jgi:hypothetical protein
MMSFIIARIEVSAQNSGTLSWWSSFGSGACRPSALTVSTSIPPAAVSCADTWAGAVTTTFTGGYVPDGPYSEGIGIIVALPDGQTEALVPGVEYFAFNLLINSGLTVGPGACSGCDVPACVAWRGMEIQQPPNPGGPTVYLAGGGEYLVTWQSASLTSYGCRLATPALNRTWGAVKSLYR